MKSFYSIMIFGLITTSCNTEKPDSTKLDSDDCERKADRIERLEREIKTFSELQDAEFELFNVNGFHDQQISVPGASSWDYKFAVRINTADIYKWTSGMTAVQLKDYDDSWTKEVIEYRKQNWALQSPPKYFIREGENVTMLLFIEEGIIFKRVINE